MQPNQAGIRLTGPNAPVQKFRLCAYYPNVRLLLLQHGLCESLLHMTHDTPEATWLLHS